MAHVSVERIFKAIKIASFQCFVIISYQALAREGDYKIHHVSVCERVRECVTQISPKLL